MGSTKKSFDTANAEAKIEDFRFHDLRHCFVTRMRREGVPDHVIRAITGNKTMSVFMRYDSGPTDEQLKQAVSNRYLRQTYATEKKWGMNYNYNRRKYLISWHARQDSNLRPAD